MTNLLLAIIATTLIISVALLDKRRTREERTRDDEEDLTRRHPAGRSFEPPQPGAPEWTPPGRDPEAHA